MDTATPTPPGSPHTGPATDRPVMLDAPALAQLREDFGGDWDIYRNTATGAIVARHRTEPYDGRREQWIAKTRLETATPEEMYPKLALQQAVREAEAPR